MIQTFEYGNLSLKFMFPILFSVGSFSISTFAVFVTAAFLFAVFTIWRLARAWDIEEEKALDFTILTFIGGIIVSRLYFVTEHLEIFLKTPLNILLFFRQPGFSFWGGFLGGWLTLYLLSRKNKIDFWHVADLASVAFLGSMIFTDLGCFFAGCDLGIPSNAFFALKIPNQAQKIIPVSLIEAFLLYISFVRIWPIVTHFHSRGFVVGITLITLGIVKTILEPFRAVHSSGAIFSATLIILGTFIFYKSTQRSILKDVKQMPVLFIKLFSDKQTQLALVQFVKKWWYNQKTLWIWKANAIKKNIRRINARSNK